MNFLGDLFTGGKLVAQEALEHEPLSYTISDTTLILAIRERGISFTGEDFDVYNAKSKQPFCHVRGALLHLPGKDKMKLYQNNNQLVAELDRKLVAFTPTYDILRGDGNKLGWIEKKVVAFTDTFEVHLEGKGLFGPLKPPAAYWLEGDFLDRRFIMKNAKGQVVAKVTKDGWIQFDAFNSYQVQVAPGMDAVLVVACACAIDEEFDEEHQQRERKQGGPF